MTYLRKRLTHRAINENLRGKQITFFQKRFKTRRRNDILYSQMISCACGE